MRVMVFAKATEDSEKGVPPTTEAFEAMDRFTEELVKAGVMLAGAGLKPSAPRGPTASSSGISDRAYCRTDPDHHRPELPSSSRSHKVKI
jgi:hypothetical protein